MAVVSFAGGDVVTTLVSVLRAATGFRAPTETGSDIVVFDGPVVGGGSFPSSVVIGGSGEPEDVQRPVRFRSEWHDFDLTMDEQGTIECAVVVWSGEAHADVFADQRAAVFDILEDVDTAIRSGNTAAALAMSPLLWAHVSGGELRQASASGGTRSVLNFTIDYRAQLTVT